MNGSHTTGSPRRLPRIAVQSIAGGMLLMAVFTLMWAGIAESGLKQRDHAMIGIFFSLISLLLVVYALYLFAAARSFPALTTAEDKAKGKRMGIRFGVLFGSEGLAIGVAVGLLVSLDHADLVIPVIALIVGLHFYPMSKIFKRTIDYYLATWTCLVALTGLFLSWEHLLSRDGVFAIVGIGVAMATSTYGLFMFYMGFRLPKH